MNMQRHRPTIIDSDGPIGSNRIHREVGTQLNFTRPMHGTREQRFRVTRGKNTFPARKFDTEKSNSRTVTDRSVTQARQTSKAVLFERTCNREGEFLMSQAIWASRKQKRAAITLVRHRHSFSASLEKSKYP